MNLAPALAMAFIGAAPAIAAARGPLPSAEQVAGWLVWEDGRLCRDLIDACLDENGNGPYDSRQYSVSNLKCRARPQGRAECSFTSLVDGQTAPPQHCTATFKRRRLDNGELDWEFAYRPLERARLSSAPILKCN